MKERAITLPMLVLLAAAGSGCANNSVVPVVTFLDTPSVGEIAEAGRGSAILQKSRIYEVDGLRLKSQLILERYALRIELDAGDYVATWETESNTYYLPVYLGMMRTEVWGQPSRLAGLRKREEDGYLEVFFFISGSDVVAFPIERPEILAPITLVAADEPSFLRELIYMGITGDMIEVLYREFRYDIARPTLIEDLVFDLSESNVIGFQDVRIEIEDADNTRVRYSVISGFPDIE